MPIKLSIACDSGSVGSFGQVMTRRDVARNPLLGPIKPFRPRGNSGLEIRDFLPEIAEHADGLGSENEDMPAYVVLPDPGGGVKGGPPAWGSGREQGARPRFPRDAVAPAGPGSRVAQ